VELVDGLHGVRDPRTVGRDLRIREEAEVIEIFGGERRERDRQPGRIVP